MLRSLRKLIFPTLVQVGSGGGGQLLAARRLVVTAASPPPTTLAGGQWSFCRRATSPNFTPRCWSQELPSLIACKLDILGARCLVHAVSFMAHGCSLMTHGQAGPARPGGLARLFISGSARRAHGPIRPGQSPWPRAMRFEP